MNVWDTYVEEVLNGTIAASRWVKLAAQRHVDDLEQGSARGLYFDAEEAQSFIAFFERFLQHSKGRWAGQPFLLLPWQQFAVASLFGWKKADGSRRFSTLYTQVGRKNGKTQLLAGIGLAMLDFDGEPAAEVVFAATKKDQAKIAHDEATRMAKSSPALSKRVTILRNNIHVKATSSKCVPLSSDANTLDGLSVSCGVLDEFHAAKDANLLNVLKSATGARISPLIAVITTAGFNVDGPCFQLMRSSCDVLEGKSTDDSLFALIYTLDEEDDFGDSSVWIKSNPSLGETISKEYLQKELTQARNYGGSMLTNFRTKHMNEWVRSSSVWIQDEVFTNNKSEVEPSPTAKCWGGLDLASVSDVTALNLVWPTEDGGYLTRSWYWLPEEAVTRRLASSGSHIYETFDTLDNVFLTEGNVTDYDSIRRFLTGYHVEGGVVKFDEAPLASRFNIEAIAFDRFNSSQCVLNLAADGLNLVPYGQGFVSMSTPCKEVERLMAEGKIAHDGDPVLRYMFGNVTLKTDPSGNIKPDKEKSGDKIDGVVAHVMAIGQAMTDQSKAPQNIPDNYNIRTL